MFHSKYPITEPVRILSRRQLEVKELLCQGLTDKEIANRLGIAFRTVKWHVHLLLQFYKVKSRRLIMYRKLGSKMAVVH